MKSPKKKKPTMPANPLYGLVCSSGGVYGAYQVGVSKYIHEHFCRGLKSPFQLFAGISCGCLNTTYLACHSADAYNSHATLEKLWIKFHVPEYQDLSGSIRKILLRKFGLLSRSHEESFALLDPTPMVNIINEGVTRADFHKSFKAGTTLGVAIAATDVATCFPVWFVEGPRAVEWERFHSIGVKTKITVDHVAASCSYPFFLPPRKLDGRFYLDGSLNLERPFSAVIGMGATKILGISTRPRKPPQLIETASEATMDVSSLIRFMLRAYEQNGMVSESEQIELLNRMVAPNNVIKKSPTRLGATNALFDKNGPEAGYNPIDMLVIYPPKSLETMLEERLPDSIFKKNHILQSKMFTFDVNVIRSLMEIGYEIGKSKHEELAQFFRSPYY